jgi:hypothetical protein
MRRRPNPGFAGADVSYTLATVLKTPPETPQEMH